MMTMDDKEKDKCPICHNDKYLNPNLRLLVSPCYHKMCEPCIVRLFLAGPAPCPKCKQTLRKSDFVTQTFEDLRVEKEIRIRKRVGKYFNKRLEDFDNDLRRYNDYLEEVEVIMFNLINDVDVQATNERIDQFRQENKDLIAMNMSKQLNEDKLISHRLKREREEKLMRRDAYLAQAVMEARAKEAERETVINELANSDKSAHDIIESFKKKQAMMAENLPRVELPTLSYDEEDLNAPLVMDDQGEFDAMDNLYQDSILLPIAPSYTDPWTQELIKDKRARASGYIPHWTYSRAIFSSFSGLIDE